jgi:signal transduction histidine kinase/ActR/RegA family two-component response regulator
MTPHARRPLDSEGVFGAILDALVEPVLVVGPDGVLELANTAAIQVLGADRDVGRPIDEHIRRVAPRTRDRAPLPLALHPIRRALMQQQAVIGAELLLDIDSRPVTCVVNAVPLPRPLAPTDQTSRGVLAVFYDVTEARRLEGEVAHQSARLQAIVDLVEEGIAVVDADSRLSFINNTGRRLVPFVEGMALADRLRAAPLLDAEERPLPAEAYPSARGLRGEHVTDVPVIINLPHGARRHLRISAHPLRRPDGAVEAVLLTWKDVTAETRTRRELEAARETAESASRLKDRFIAALSHELRTPLQPILGWTEVLRRHRGLDEVTTRALEAIHRNIRQQVRLVDDLLDLSRIVHGKFNLRFETVDLRDAVRAGVESFEEAASIKRVRLTTTLAAQPMLVWGDGARLQQITANLVSNALKFTPAGGRVNVRLGARGERARLEVEDTGEGIAPADLPFIFDAFRQGAEPRAGGLGLGLDLVRRLTELHGGSVQVRSEGLGRGATFVVDLPLAPAPPATAQAGVRPAGRLDDRTVLVIEDDDDTRTVLAFMLQSEGAQVAAAGSGRDGVDTAERLRPQVVLCDVGLPDIDGLEVARRLRRNPELARTRLIALTGYGQAEDVRAAIEAGFDAHVTKPINLDQLMALLARRDEPLTGARGPG